MKDLELIPDTIEPINNIDFHLSPIGKLSNTLFYNISHTGQLVEEMKDLLRIIDPTRMNNNVIFYKELRDAEGKPLQTKMFYHNKMKQIFDSARCLLTDMVDADQEYFGLTVIEIREIYFDKRREYEIDSYRRDLRRKNKLSK